MAIFKKSIIIILCMILALSPLLYCGDFSYADDDGWAQTSSKEETCAIFKAYFATRNFYSKVDPVKGFTTITYNMIDQACRALFDKSALEIGQSGKYKYNNSGFLQFFIDDDLALHLNSVYEYLLTKYGIRENEQQRVYSGELFTDSDGNKCSVFYLSRSAYYSRTTNYENLILKFGTPYRFIGSDYYNSHDGGTHLETIRYLDKYDNIQKVLNYRLNIQDKTASTQVLCIQPSDNETVSTSYPVFWQYKSGNLNWKYIDGYLIIAKTPDGKYYLGSYLHQGNHTVSPQTNYYTFGGRILLTDPFTEDVNQDLKQGSLNEDDNEPKTITTKKTNIPDFNDDPEPEVTTKPVDNSPPTDPNVPNPTGGNVNPEDGDVNWHMPDLHVDWDLGDFSNIFPFSIPFDIIELFDIVDSEPVTPAIYQEVDFGAFNYTIDFDLSYFDEFMEYVRAMELFLYTLTLFIATRGIFKIY